MTIEQIYTGCLAQGAYYITSKGEAAIVDPLREVAPYLERLEKDGVQLKYIFETHFHADFVSGHVDLRAKTGADIVFGPDAACAFGCISAKDGQVFTLGDITIKVLHTPGHTMESTTYLLKDTNGKDYCIFSGDTLFLGDVGRPDLAQKAANLTKEQLAGLLYESLIHKIMPLADEVIVYPGHGEGSTCGKHMMKETIDTLGHQKRVNYALNQPNKEAFIKAVTKGLTPPPDYFGFNVAMNKKGYERFDNVLHKGLHPLNANEFEAAAANHHALIIDTRSNTDFWKGFIPQSVNIGLYGYFAPWVGSYVADVQQPLLLVTDEGKITEAITRLSRVGFDNVLGYLEAGFPAWVDAGKQKDTIHRITAEQFASFVHAEDDMVIDVRKESEFATSHVAGAINQPLAYIHEWIQYINPAEHFYLYCAGGYRSMMAASILKARGNGNFTEVGGGFEAIATTNIPVTDFVSQDHLLKV